MAPTKAEVEEHNRTHAEYRSWCPHCVAGKSISAQHCRRDPNEEKLGVTISIDYAFRTAEEAEEDLAPILVAYDMVGISLIIIICERRQRATKVKSKLAFGFSRQ